MDTELLLAPVVRSLERSRLGRRGLRSWRKFWRPWDPSKPRVLCVGFVKTGTSSFGLAMRQLGLSHYGYDPDLERDLNNGNLERCLRWAAHFNALDDLPWSAPAFIAAFRQRFPGSYYVLLERDEQEWLQSYFNFFGEICSAEEAIRRLRSHQTQVRNLLMGESHLLQMNICAGDGFEKLCPFLGLPHPNRPFPWVIPQK